MTDLSAGAMITMNFERVAGECNCGQEECSGARFHIVSHIKQGATVPGAQVHPQSIEASNLLQLASYAFGITTEAMQGKARNKSMTAARCFFVTLVRDRLGLSWGEIGEILNRDHTTMIHIYGRRGHFQSQYAKEWNELVEALE